MLISSQFHKDDHEALCDLIVYLKVSSTDIVLVGQVDKERLYLLLDPKSKQPIEEVVQKIYQLVIQYGSNVVTYPLQFSCSIGVVENLSASSDAADAASKAFVALSEVKQSNQHYVIYKDEKRHLAEAKNHMILANYLQDALNEKKLRLAYQPITDSRTGAIHHYECLLRIVGPNHSTTSAGPFIPIAESLGFMDAVDSLVLEMAVDDLKAHPEIILAINVSNASVHSLSWQKMATTLLRRRDIASRMIVEITETSEQQDLKNAALFIHKLKDLGCKIALDDFGSGYTSFAQLQALPVDSIKIDGSFVRNIIENKESRFFVGALKEFGDNFGLKTVAEFVESKEIADMLCEMGIDYLQGNYLSPAVDYRPWL